MIENKKILVLGLARSGFAVAKLLANKNEIVVTTSGLLLSNVQASHVQTSPSEEHQERIIAIHAIAKSHTFFIVVNYLRNKNYIHINL